MFVSAIIGWNLAEISNIVRSTMYSIVFKMYCCPYPTSIAAKMFCKLIKDY